MKLKLFGRKSELKHEEALELLSPYIDERLDPGDRERLELHLEGCAGCAAELQALRATSAVLHALPPVRPPRNFTLQAAPQPVVAPSRPLFALRLASGVAAAAFVALIAASALLSTGTAPQTTSMADYQTGRQAPETVAAPSNAASSQSDSASPKRAVAPVAPATTTGAAAGGYAPAASQPQPAAAAAPQSAPASSAQRDSVPVSGVSGVPTQQAGVGALSAQSAPAAAPAAQPAGARPADRNPLQSFLGTLQVVAGSLALLLGLAAVGVWWSQKSQR